MIDMDGGGLDSGEAAMRVQDLMTGVVGLLGPILGALAAALGLWLKDRLQRRDEQFVRRTALDQAAQEVAFIQAWVAAHQTVNPVDQTDEVRQRASRDLERVYSVLTTPMMTRSINERQPIDLLGALKSWLLFKKLETIPASLGLILYWALLLTALFWVSAVTAAFIADPSPSGFFVWLLFMTVPFGVLWGLRAFLLWVDQLGRRRADRRAAPQRSLVAWAPAPPGFAQEASSPPAMTISGPGGPIPQARPAPTPPSAPDDPARHR